jgi:hypothetical protein
MAALDLFHQIADDGADPVRTADVGQLLGFADAFDRRLDSDQHKHPRLFLGRNSADSYRPASAKGLD